MPHPNHALSVAAPSSAPTVTYVVQDSTTVRISWTSIPVASRNGVVRQYQIRLRNIEDGNERMFTDSSSPLIISDLRPFYNYRVSVAASTVALGPYSSEVSIQMPQDGTAHHSNTLLFTVLSGRRGRWGWGRGKQGVGVEQRAW